MYTYDNVYHGLEKFIEHEIITKVPGWKKWIVGTGLELALDNGNNIFHNLKDHELIKMLDIIDDADNIDIAKLYRCLKKQSESTPITFDIPLIGTMTLTHDDVDKLYYYITE